MHSAGLLECMSAPVMTLMATRIILKSEIVPPFYQSAPWVYGWMDGWMDGFNEKSGYSLGCCTSIYIYILHVNLGCMRISAS